MIIRIKPKTTEDREKIVIGLANSGYKVWVIEESDWPHGSNFYILFEEDEMGKASALGTYTKAEK